ncbi:hypothetical protein FQA39_LY18919 [Lamprigera yunnana]|nr:hypothetical protein FQA39_LY18919 [Lamprigera yunnana]
MVMALYAAAERIEDMAMSKARSAIRDLLNLAPPEADVLQPDGSSQRMLAANVPIGAVLRIAPGARVPLDGTVTQGQSAVDQAPITGESALADKSAGEPLYAGSVNQNAELQNARRCGARAKPDAAASSCRRAGPGGPRRPTQRFVDQFAARYSAHSSWLLAIGSLKKANEPRSQPGEAPTAVIAVSYDEGLQRLHGEDIRALAPTNF